MKTIKYAAIGIIMFLISNHFPESHIANIVAFLLGLVWFCFSGISMEKEDSI